MDATHHPMLWRIRRLATARGWTMARLARRSRLRAQNLVRWARAWPCVSPAVTARVAAAFGITPGELGADLHTEPVDVHSVVLEIIRGACEWGSSSPAVISSLAAMDLPWVELVEIDRNWRASYAVRAWARREMRTRAGNRLEA